MNLAHRLLYVLIRLADKYIFLNYYCMATKCIYLYIFVDFPGGSIPESARSPRGGNGNPLQCSCLGNPVDRRSQVGYSPWGSNESDMTEWLNKNNHMYFYVIYTCIFIGINYFIILAKVIFQHNHWQQGKLFLRLLKNRLRKVFYFIHITMILFYFACHFHALINPEVSHFSLSHVFSL